MEYPPVDLKDRLDEKIASVFRKFDMKRNNIIDSSHTGDILRILGLVLPEREVEEFIEYAELPGKKGIIHLSAFIMFTRKLLRNGDAYKPLSYEMLLDLFKSLDPKNKGYIARDEFSDMMKKYGEPMSEESLNTMISAAMSREDENKIDYEEYARSLYAKESLEEDSIFKLANECMKLKK